ncbi:hypothetical protein F5883DRAFT_442274 [Diaporthe sp. PMI_573]|nr:hypothetical protein F5883DRAFT_610336 [Diaporthaceae sp. PMI_573]KAH8742476.1 hypothetical protein F5883DRAFT_442274 [Diaporthaceae sp. PMI_573]
MLALAALHKARLGLHSHQRAELSVQAERHHVVGVQGSTALLESINTADYEVLHTSAILIGLINLAMGPRPGEYIAFSDQASPNFLGLLRGLRSIRYHGRRCNSSPNVPPSAGSASASRFAAPKQQQQQPPAGSPFADNTKTHLRHLYARAQKIPEAGVRRAYILALDDLEQFFILVDGPPECAGDNPPPVFDHEHRQSTFGWLYRLEDEFLERLQSKESLALVIFAYFVIIMKERETDWLASGWAEHVMPYICREVAPDVRHLVRWPLLRLSGLTQDSHFSDNTSDPGN